MASISTSFYASILLSSIFLHLFFQHDVAASDLSIRPNRKSLEIVIGGGIFPSPPEYNPPPEPFYHPPPPPHVSPRVLLAYKVIQNFKRRITCDPKGILKTWVGFDVCKYKGFLCGTHPVYKQTAVSGVVFNGFLFAGPELTLDGFVDGLEDITIFHANSNNFTGKVPVGINKLQYFYELDLSNNKLTGDFPMEVIGATQLTFLDLRYNSFSGKVPPQVFNLDVDVLFINNNDLEQPLPQNIGSTPALYLTFANNKFTGPIPKSIKQASKTLKEVLFLRNNLSGCLPYEIGYLKKAILFDASHNQLTGPIPHSFACLSKMEQLNFANNQLYGKIPESVCKLPSLDKLTLENNYITDAGPECRKLIEKKVLNVKKNCIRDLPNQRSEAECNAFLKKPKYCDNDHTLTYIPCESKPYEQPIPPPASPPVTYGALSPHP
ncbi:uncharacterized protein At4g06744 [Ziziphus jujuba]|uniref:Uncharacterized protein At4g06744 n=2 Tax=Ziziphus jujuba TaxID=326968 RepID=A0A6P4AUD4_ZIZJJ|nr:uncharacterized protein At4g06744 [Ziziphus jujuba]KAH7518019.1 hypothetical protein FEM48_Zijuj09G0126200 [Ziziphus jujuba var. spinosa]